MPRSKRKVLEAAEEASTPPEKLAEGQEIVQVVKMAANNLVHVKTATGSQELLVEMTGKFRSTIWIRRGGYVVIDTKAFEHRENKLDGEIVNVVRDEKLWRKQSYWPKEFEKQSLLDDDDDSEDESTMGKMPPSDSEDEE